VDFDGMPSEKLDSLQEAVEREQERRHVRSVAERQAARLAADYVRAGGLFDALINAMCEGLEQAAVERAERERVEKEALSGVAPPSPSAGTGLARFEGAEH